MLNTTNFLVSIPENEIIYMLEEYSNKNYKIKKYYKIINGYVFETTQTQDKVDLTSTNITEGYSIDENIIKLEYIIENLVSQKIIIIPELRYNTEVFYVKF